MKFKINALLLALVLILFTFSACKNYDASKYGHFERVGDLNVARTGHLATLLKDGQVLIAGGSTKAEDKKKVFRSVADLEIYNPNTRLFSIVSKLNEAHGTDILLPDGRVVFVGEPGRHIEIYDPKTNQVIIAGETRIPRTAHSITLLKDGTVLITGGDSPVKTDNRHYTPDLPNDLAEIFDPKTGKCRFVGKLNIPRSGHQALLLPNGKVAIIGGDFPTPFGVHPNYGYYTVEFYDPKTSKFTLSSKIRLHVRIGGISLLLNNGKVLIFDGHGPIGTPSIPVELIDPLKETVELRPYNHGGEARQGTRYARINNDNIFLFGGEMFRNDEALYNIPSNSFTKIPGERMEQYGASVTALKDGSILISGGSKDPFHYYKNSELFVSSKVGEN